MKKARLIVASLVIGLAVSMHAQAPFDRLRALPGFAEYSRMQDELRKAPAFESGAVDVVWADDTRTLTYVKSGRSRQFDLTSKTDVDAGPASPPRLGPARTPSEAGPCPRVPVERGRQSACAASPDGTRRAIYRERNLYLSRADGGEATAITTDGSTTARIKYGVASWVYGEELDQTTAIWWSPDSRKVAFYRFDERPVRDYYLQMDQTGFQDTLDVEAYPKAGTDNPIAEVLVYDIESKRTITLDVRDGRPFTDDVVGHYVFAMQWAADSSELRMHRTDRKQQTMELVGCSPVTTKCRRIIREESATGWVENRPTFRLLSDGRRFIWGSDRTGWRNYYLYDLSGRLINPITSTSGFDASTVVKVDEPQGTLFYMAGDGDNFLKPQLHKVGLDGRGDRRLTDPGFAHRVTVSPDGRYFSDVFQTHDEPPVTQILTTDGVPVATLARSDLSRFQTLGLRKHEMFAYKAADGNTGLLGSIAFPASFDASKKYPVLMAVYGGPGDRDQSPTETFAEPSLTTEFGFLVVSLSTRAMPGLGRRTLDSLYRKLGQTEVDDFAEGVKALATRPYVDRSRIGILGTSYGGYVALLALLRYPDLFAAASASSPVTDWRHYDTIYTERYMSLPKDNAEGYDKGSAIQYAGALRGRLLLYYGTADNNVHPANSLQFIQALNRAGKSFEVQVGPDAGHSAVPSGRMMEFFVENLIARPERLRVN